MLKHLFGIFLAALLLSGVAGTAEAARGNAFCPGGISGGAKVLQERMVKALAADSTGRSVKLEYCNATPEQFLLAFQKGSPTAGLTHVSQLPEYISKFRPVELDRTLIYRMSCVTDTEVIMGCVERKLEDGEVVYADHTGTKVMPSGCANPGIAPPLGEVVVGGTEVTCVEVRVPVKRNVTHVARWATAGSTPVSDEAMRKCFKYQLPGESKWTSEWPTQCKWGEWQEPTPDRDGQPRITRCNVPELGRPLIKRGGIVLNGQYDGYVRVMLPIHFGDTSTDVAFWVCLEDRVQHSDGFLEIRHADGMITTPDDFQYPPEGESGGKRVTFPSPVFNATAGQKLAGTR